MTESLPRVSPYLWLGDQARTAAQFWTTVMPNSRFVDTGTGVIVVWLNGQLIRVANYTPAGQLPAFAFVVEVDTQTEVDHLWDQLVAQGGRHLTCGWLVDRFGVSWQIVPRIVPELMRSPDRARAARVHAAMERMTKLIVSELEAA